MAVDLTAGATAAARALLAQILAHARERGIDQRTLATRAGISPESLSRLKRTGTCRLTTAFELARAAGLGAFDLRAAPPPNAAASIAASKLSAGRRRSIGGAELISALEQDEPPARCRSHVYGFFEELPIEAVHDVVLEAELDYAHLVDLATALGAEGETVEWLAEMAGDRVAPAA